MTAKPLNNNQITELASLLPNWEYKRDLIQREFLFNDFSEAFGFMSRVALLSEQHNHHPNWYNIYNSVTIKLTTHDLGKLSNLDLRLALAIDGLMKSSNKKNS
tara:strand:- start:266 stop:574 length:309 start_codon:yes stop_codon:yes gene_type:complete